MKCCEITFSWGNYCILTYFSCCLLELRTKDHRPRSPFFELQATLKARTCQITIIERNIKAILRAYFSSLRFDSGKIFKINIWNIFSRGLRTAYCTYSAVIKLVKRHHEPPVLLHFCGDRRWLAWFFLEMFCLNNKIHFSPANASNTASFKRKTVKKSWCLLIHKQQTNLSIKLPTIPPGLAGKIVKYRQLSEPIRLQDLEVSLARKLGKNKAYYCWLGFTGPKLYVTQKSF